MPIKIPITGSLSKEEIEIIRKANAIEARESVRDQVLYACSACLTRIWLPRGSSEICPECGRGLMFLDAPMKSPDWVKS